MTDTIRQQVILCECGTGPKARRGHKSIYRDGTWHHYDGTHCRGSYYDGYV